MGGEEGKERCIHLFADIGRIAFKYEYGRFPVCGNY